MQEQFDFFHLNPNENLENVVNGTLLRTRITKVVSKNANDVTQRANLNINLEFKVYTKKNSKFQK